MRRKQRKAAQETRCLQQKRQSPPPQFSPDDQLIFSYHNGERIVEADPLALHCALMDTPDFIANLKTSALQSEIAAVAAAQATKKVVETVRRVFGIKEFHSEPDPRRPGQMKRSGLTDASARNILDAFATFVEDLKKKAGISQTSPSPSESCPQADSSPTPNTSGSTSTASAPCIGEPCPPPSGQALLSAEQPLDSFGTL